MTWVLAHACLRSPPPEEREPACVPPAEADRLEAEVSARNEAAWVALLADRELEPFAPPVAPRERPRDVPAWTVVDGPDGRVLYGEAVTSTCDGTETGRARLGRHPVRGVVAVQPRVSEVPVDVTVCGCEHQVPACGVGPVTFYPGWVLPDGVAFSGTATHLSLRRERVVRTFVDEDGATCELPPPLP